MTFSYGGDPAASVVDQVRFLVDDRTPPPFLEDEEIQAMLTAHPNPLRAAAACADQIALQLGKKAQTKSVGGLSISRPDLRRSYTELADQLRKRALLEGAAVPLAGGLSVFGKSEQEQDTDAVQPAFRRKTGTTPNTAPRRSGGWN